MNPPNQPHRGPNGSPKPVVWTPQERMIWLNSHNCPPHYRLCTTSEIGILEQQFKRAIVLDKEFAALVHVLNYWDYWTQFPDVRTAVTNAAFDARKLARAADKAEETIADALQVFALLAADHPNFAARADALAVRANLEDTLKFIRDQKAATPPAPVTQPQPEPPKS